MKPILEKLKHLREEFYRTGWGNRTPELEHLYKVVDTLLEIVEEIAVQTRPTKMSPLNSPRRKWPDVPRA